MSRSKGTARETAIPAPRRSIFTREGGGLRTGWLLAVGLFGYALAVPVLRWALSEGLAALFGAWNVNAENAHLAPGWARLFYAWQNSLVGALSCLALLAVSIWLRRLWLGKTHAPGFSPTALLRPAAAGLCLALVVAALSLIPDSSRLEWPLTRPRWGVGALALCLFGLLSALAGEAFGKRVLYDGLKERWGRAWATVVACAAYFLANRGWAGNVPCAVNALLLGLAGCLLYERHGLWAAVGFRWAWSAAVALLLGFGGGDAALYRLYGVSEILLTGGDGGPACGLWLTLQLAACIGWSFMKARRHGRGRIDQ